MTFARLLRSAFAPRPAARRPARRLSVESLEGRDNPSGGLLDPTFGTGGADYLPNGTADMVSDNVVQPDGKIVNVGTVGSNSSQLSVTRLNPNGTLDPTFGTGGAVKFTLGNGVYSISSVHPSVALQPDGKILVSAPVIYKSSFWGSPDTEFVIGRLNANGTLDTSFGSQHGWWISNPTKSYDEIAQLAVVPNGTSFSIYAGGYSGSTTATQGFTVVKLNANGQPDTTYGTNGIAVAPHLGASTASNITVGFAVSPSGEAFIAGTNRFLVAVNPTGHLDTNFNGTGYVTIGNAAYAVALQGNDVLVSGLYVTPGVMSQGLVQRYTMTGALDTTFGVNGTYLTPASLFPSTPGSLLLHGLAVEADGSIALMGRESYAVASRVTHIALALGHLSADGVADASFGTDGTGFVVYPQFDNHYAYDNWSLTLDLDGNYLVSGRYTPNFAADPSSFQGTVLRFTYP